MEKCFDIKYLELNWYDKETLTKITESLFSLNVEYDTDENLFKAETTIYPKVENIKKGVLAFRILNNKSDKPYIQLPNNDKKYLTPIIDPDTQLTWWILQEKWDETYKQWFGIATNIVGKLSVILQGQRCDIIINGSDFNLEQLDKYLFSFKNDLWELILDESSITQVDTNYKQAMGINQDVIECITNLTSHMQKIILNPKVELREIQAIKPRKQVKPVNRTFMELTIKANQRLLTSRATKPSYNTPENRYILFIIERCYRIIKQIILLSQNKIRRFESMARKFQEQHDNILDYVIVDRNLVVSDLKKLQERKNISFWKEKFNRDLSSYELDFTYSNFDQDIYFKISGYSKGNNGFKDGFFVLEWNGAEWTRPEGKSLILKFEEADKLHAFLNILKPEMELKIIGNYKIYVKDKVNIYTFNSIQSIELHNYPSALTKAKENYKKEFKQAEILSKREWKKELSSKEIDELKNEKRSLLNRVEYYTETQHAVRYVFERINPKLKQIFVLINELKKLGVKSSSYFPNSMTFVQNPHYQGVHNSYKNLRELVHLHDDDLLLSLEEIEKIGIINMPILYERWVLIQIIMVLKNEFRFVLEDNWKNTLISAIKDERKDIEIKFKNQLARRYIKLSYEKILSNGKRPDFILDLFYYPNDSIGNKRNVKEKRFVMDAKFYDKSTFKKAGGMLDKIQELYTGKNYSEDGKNPVFLIHPCNHLIDEPISSQQWGARSFFGESSPFGHNQGAIYLNPVDNKIHNDELQLLLGLFLQYDLEDNNIGNRYNDKTGAVPICIRCGSTKLREINKMMSTRSRSVYLICEECKLLQSYNHCVNKHRLIKNGPYWTYHSLRAIDPFNVKCPHCGEWGGW